MNAHRPRAKQQIQATYPSHYSFLFYFLGQKAFSPEALHGRIPRITRSTLFLELVGTAVWTEIPPYSILLFSSLLNLKLQ